MRNAGSKIRRPLRNRGSDPRICNIAIDANALDRDGTPRDALVDRVLALREADQINFVVASSVRQEVSHPHTPGHVQRAILPEIYTLPVSKTPEELETLANVRALLRGNATSSKHDADAHHLFEAAKYGGGYFVTHDKRILDRRAELRSLLGPALQILTLQDFLDVYDEFCQSDA